MEKSIINHKKNISEDLLLYELYSHVSTLLTYVVMKQAGPEKAMQPSIGFCEIQGE